MSFFPCDRSLKRTPKRSLRSRVLKAIISRHLRVYPNSPPSSRTQLSHPSHPESDSANNLRMKTAAAAVAMLLAVSGTVATPVVVEPAGEAPSLSKRATEVIYLANCRGKPGVAWSEVVVSLFFAGGMPFIHRSQTTCSTTPTSERLTMGSTHPVVTSASLPNPARTHGSNGRAVLSAAGSRPLPSSRTLKLAPSAVGMGISLGE